MVTVRAPTGSLRHAAQVSEDRPDDADKEQDELAAGLKRRDGRFVWRLVMRLAIAILASIWLAGWLTRSEVGGCAARGFQDVTAPPASDQPPGADGP